MENKRKFDRNKVREGVSDWDERGWTSGYWKVMQLWRQLSRRTLWLYVAWVCDIQLAQTAHKQEHKESSNTPRRRGSNLFSSISLALVPASIRSSLVRTPMVRRPKSYYQCSELKKITITSTHTHAPHTHTHQCLTLRVDVFGQLKGVGVGEVTGGRHDGQDEAVFVAHILHDHVPDLVLDVFGLVADGQLGDARQVHQGEVQHWPAHTNAHQCLKEREDVWTHAINMQSAVTIWWVNLQVHGHGREAFVRAGESVCLSDDLPADLVEVCELLSPRVEKLSIFWEDGQMGI